MGAVFRPKDLGKGYKRIIENAIKDLSPDTRDNVIELFDSWQDINSVQNLTDEERKALKDILKDSLTFD